MSGYKIGVVKLHNFGPFEDAEIDFSAPGLTAIEGVIEGMSGCDDNGAGKSFLYDSVPWATYDRCVRPKYDGDNVCRLGWKDGHHVPLANFDGTWVEVNLLGGPTPIRWVRYRKHPVYKNQVRLFVDESDVTMGTNAQTDVKIANILGMDFTTFVNAVMFGCRDDVKSFLSSTDAGRKQMLEKLFGLELYADAQKVAQQELRALAPRLTQLDTQKVSLQTDRAAQDALLNQALTSDSSAEVEFKLNVAKAAVAAKAKAMKAANDKLEVAQKKVNVEEAKAQDVEAEWQKRVDKHAIETAKAEKVTHDLEQKLAMERGRATTSRSDKAKWSKLAGKECPTCAQAVTKKHTDTVSARIDAELARYEKSIKALEIEVEVATEAWNSLGEAPEAPEHPAYAEAQEDLAVCEDAVERASSEWSQAKSVLASAQETATRLSENTNEIRDAIKEIENKQVAAETELCELRAKADQLAFWVEGFGNGGVKSLLIERELPEVNRRATGYAQRLLGPGSRLKLKATKDLKSRDAVKEEMSVDVVIPGCTVSFHGASKGQKLRLDLSTLLGIREILVSRSSRSFSNFFADELFDGVDKTGCQAIVELLREIAAIHPVCLVTHDPRIRQAATRVVRVHHSGGVARLLVNGASPVNTVSKPARLKVVRRG